VNKRGTARHPEFPSATAEFLYIPEAAALLGTTEKGIRARVARRQLPFRQLAGRIIFKRSELLDFLGKLDGVTIAEAIANAKAGR
jgi:Helix-turn-helix domain